MATESGKNEVDLASAQSDRRKDDARLTDSSGNDMNADSSDRPPKYDAFLSYSGRDRRFAMALRAYLHDSGFRIFIDAESTQRSTAAPTARRIKRQRSVTPPHRQGGMIQQINDALRDSETFLLLVTPEAIDSSWVQLELEASAQQSRERLFLELEPVNIPKKYLADPDNTFELARGDRTIQQYEKHIRQSMEDIAKRLECIVSRSIDRRVPSKPILPKDTITRIPAPVRETLSAALAPLIDTTINPRLDVIRRALCSALDIDGEQHEFSRQPLKDHAEFIINHALVLITRKHSPLRGAHRLATVLLDGFKMDPKIRANVASVREEVEVRIQPDVDEAMVTNVQDELWPRYQVLEVLGGSKTVTLRAEDISLGREVAIKVLRGRVNHHTDTGRVEEEGKDIPEHLESDDVHAFRELTRHAAKTRHPGLNRVYGARLRDSHAKIQISEFIPGYSLNRISRCASVGARLKGTILARIIRNLGATLGDLEADGFNHLNLSPRSMFVDTNYRVMLSSLGVVPLAADARRLLPICREGEEMFLPSPETRSASELSSKIMQFAIARVVLMLLLGEKRCTADLDRTKSISDASELVMPRSTRDQLVQALSRATHADPTKRFPTTRHMCDELARILRGCQIEGAQTFRVILKRAKDIRHAASRDRTLVMDSLGRANQNDLIPTFSQQLMANDQIRNVFEAHWADLPGGQDSSENSSPRLMETDEAEAFEAIRLARHQDKLRRALRTIAVYGTYDAFRPRALSAIALSHGPNGYKVPFEMLEMFRATLLNCLRERDPLIARGIQKSPRTAERKRADATLRAWEAVLRRVESLLERVEESWLPQLTRSSEDRPSGSAMEATSQG